MMIESPILLAIHKFAFVDTLNGNWYLCRDTLHKIFDFPKGVEQIQFQAWPEPGRGRVEIKIKKTFKKTFKLDDRHIEIDGKKQVTLGRTMAAIMKLTKKRRTWYVKLYYWG